jgi:HAD superfamily hydrolase (TIGR01549 family)
MIKAVIFDFGQTLVNSADGFRTAEKEVQAKLFAGLGLTIWDDFLSNYRRLRKALHDQSNFSRKFLFHEVYFYYCLAPDDKLLEAWETEYWETVKANTAVFPEALDVLENLNENYQVAMITNTQGQRRSGTHRISLFPEIEKFFKVILVAGEGGIQPKPSAEPFRICLDKLNIKASEAVYVGDDYRIDVCGAADAGLHPIWLKHHSVNRNWPAVQTSMPVITSLRQLLDLKKIDPRFAED